MKKKQRSSSNISNVTFYLPKEAKQQLMFLCEMHNITPSSLCRKVLMEFLNRNNVIKQMIEYAIKQLAEKNLTQ